MKKKRPKQDKTRLYIKQVKQQLSLLLSFGYEKVVFDPEKVLFHPEKVLFECQDELKIKKEPY